ncbi:MAG: hypothetical protein QG622_653 [Actinomycetota bacterium]|nr:hypothetical protein [Actinomycetota bacterium]
MSPNNTPGKQTPHDAIRRFNKHIVNPVMLKLAGRRHWYAAALHHVGRRSGRAFVTPLVVQRVDGGLLIPLPYGNDVDWLRNLQASGTATIVDHGRTSAVGNPQLITAEQALPLVPPKRARVWRLVKIAEFVRVETVTP